ncbi:MAG: tetratricopeptide repeat protein, partial [Longimicrobiales bacterium]
VLVAPGLAAAQAITADSARVAIERAHLTGDVAALHAVHGALEREAAAGSADPLLLHYLGYALYREDTMAREDSLLERAQEVLIRSAEIMPLPETYALLETLFGRAIARSPWKGPFLARRMNRAQAAAQRLGPENPRVALQAAINAYHAPGWFGGGLDRAEAELRRALELFERDAPPAPLPAWGHAEAWAWLGRVRARRDDVAGARAAYQKALEIEPDYAWVRQRLLPELDRR